MPQDLCQPETVAGITAARESVEAHLQDIFAEIDSLQKAENFLENVDEIQGKTRKLATWRVQREQLSAVEACAATCTCDDGASLVIAEYNTLARQQDPAADLALVPLPQPASSQLIIAIVAGAAILAAYFLARRRKIY